MPRPFFHSGKFSLHRWGSRTRCVNVDVAAVRAEVGGAVAALWGGNNPSDRRAAVRGVSQRIGYVSFPSGRRSELSQPGGEVGCIIQSLSIDEVHLAGAIGQVVEDDVQPLRSHGAEVVDYVLGGHGLRSRISRFTASVGSVRLVN
jgi:hypothetical protein